MDKEQLNGRKRRIRGKVLTLAEFKDKFQLEEKEAQRLFKRFGPSEADLDLLMVAKARVYM